MNNEELEKLKQELREEIKQENKKKTKRNLIILIVLLVIVAIVFTAFVFIRRHQSDERVKQAQEEMKSSNVNNYVEGEILIGSSKNIMISIESFNSKFDSLEYAIENKLDSVYFKDYIKDDNGNFVDVDTAIDAYLKSDEGKNSIAELEKNDKAVKEEMQKVEENMNYLTEENVQIYNNDLVIYNLVSDMYDTFMKYIENPDDYANYKKEYEKIEKQIEENETYKNYELKQQYPNLY